MQPIEAISEQEALEAYRRVCEVLEVESHDEIVTQGGANWPDGLPVLCRNFVTWYEPTPWAIVWEGGPYDWAVEASFDVRLILGEMLFEPINGFALAICRA